MGKLGRLLKTGKNAEKSVESAGEGAAKSAGAVGAASKAGKAGKAGEAMDSPRDVVRDSAEVLDATGDKDFKEGGKFSKFKNWSQESMSRRQYNKQFDRGINGYQQNPGMGAGGINDMMMQQMNGATNDMNASGIVGSRMGKLASAGRMMDFVGIVKDGVKVVSSITHGDLKGAASAAMDMKRGFEGNGLDSMVDSVGKLHNNGMIDQVHSNTWSRMGKFDNGTLSQRMGFDPSMAANDPSVAMSAMNSQFRPGQGVPESFGAKPEGHGVMGKALKWGGVLAAGATLVMNDDLRHGVENVVEGGLEKVKDVAQGGLETVGLDPVAHPVKSLEKGASALVGGAGHALQLDDVLKKGEQLATGKSSSELDTMLSQNKSANPYAPPQEEGPSR